MVSPQEPHILLQGEQGARRVGLWHAPEEVDTGTRPAGRQPTAWGQGLLPQGRNCAPGAWAGRCLHGLERAQRPQANAHSSRCGVHAMKHTLLRLPCQQGHGRGRMWDAGLHLVRHSDDPGRRAAGFPRRERSDAMAGVPCNDVLLQRQDAKAAVLWAAEEHGSR